MSNIIWFHKILNNIIEYNLIFRYIEAEGLHSIRVVDIEILIGDLHRSNGRWDRGETVCKREREREEKQGVRGRGRGRGRERGREDVPETAICCLLSYWWAIIFIILKCNLSILYTYFLLYFSLLYFSLLYSTLLYSPLLNYCTLHSFFSHFCITLWRLILI